VPAPTYPEWFYYPSRTRPPSWVDDFVEVVRQARGEIDSGTVASLTSDRVLAHLAPGLAPLGYTVETSKKAADQIRLPVLFGDRGDERVAYHVDAVHDQLGVVVEIEGVKISRTAGR
jgi:hypothetical protein